VKEEIMSTEVALEEALVGNSLSHAGGIWISRMIDEVMMIYTYDIHI